MIYNVFKGVRVMTSDKYLTEKLYEHREYSDRHRCYDQEMKFYYDVSSGELTDFKKSRNTYLSPGYGVLSDDPIKNSRYHFIISVAMITRFCVEGGMEMEAAYNLSDMYIQRADKAKSVDEFDSLHFEMVNDFNDRMKKIKRGSIYSKPVSWTIDYITDNLHNKMTLSEAAEKAKITPQYLSKLFLKEVGVNFKEYIINKKVEEAENMLKYSDFSPIEIGNILNFSSHSHFINCFKKQVGMTPKEYQNKFFRVNVLSEKISCLTDKKEKEEHK